MHTHQSRWWRLKSASWPDGLAKADGNCPWPRGTGGIVVAVSACTGWVTGTLGRPHILPFGMPVTEARLAMLPQHFGPKFVAASVAHTAVYCSHSAMHVINTSGLCAATCMSRIRHAFQGNMQLHGGQPSGVAN